MMMLFFKHKNECLNCNQYYSIAVTMRQYFSGERSIFSGERYTERKYRPIFEAVNYTDRNYMNSGRKFSYLTNTYRSCIIWES